MNAFPKNITFAPLRKKRLNGICDEVLRYLCRVKIYDESKRAEKKMDAIGDNGWRTKPIKCIFLFVLQVRALYGGMH